MIKIGEQFPHFELPDENGNLVNLKQLIEKGPLVLFFYPKDNTAVCTKEVCEFKDTYTEFNSLNASVVGVSSDSQKSHKKFKEKHDLNFPLLTDEKSKLRIQANVKSSLFGLLPGRVTFVIDQNGVIKHITNNQFNSSIHISEAIVALKAIG